MKKRYVLAAAAAGFLAARTQRRWFPVRVEGQSMLPTLQPGDLLAVRPPRPGEPRVGQLVVVRHGELEIVKRVTATVDGSDLAAGEIWLAGDNVSASTDSRTTGPAARADVAGVVRARYKPVRSLKWFSP